MRKQQCATQDKWEELKRKILERLNRADDDWSELEEPDSFVDFFYTIKEEFKEYFPRNLEARVNSWYDESYVEIALKYQLLDWPVYSPFLDWDRKETQWMLLDSDFGSWYEDSEILASKLTRMCKYADAVHKAMTWEWLEWFTYFRS